ncbi:MAG: DMT family transporter, partial [Psychrobium sp.]|nr:DMT family transporter [Psychrobium sp.]
VMSSAPIFNAVHCKLFYKTAPSVNFWFGAILGLAGIALLFAADFMATVWSTDVLIGLLYALAGTWCFSIGNMVSIRNTKNAIKPFTATSHAMVYGCLALLLIILVRGHSFELDLNLRYVGGLMYLAIPASIIGFTVFLVLVDRMGASNAAYLLVITPIVALTVSSIYEGYQWTSYSVVGLLLVIAGNVCISRKTPLLGKFFNSSLRNQA